MNSRVHYPGVDQRTLASRSSGCDLALCPWVALLVWTGELLHEILRIYMDCLTRLFKGGDNFVWLVFLSSRSVTKENGLARTRGLKQKTTLARRRTVGSMPGISISEAQAAQRAKEEVAKKKSEDAAAPFVEGKRRKFRDESPSITCIALIIFSFCLSS
ncbi:hypothetical protein LWI28_005037 [Acer negundo]|uniref:Uncharacterized protein n=1 Tax=Acer negundo TaxID=4023 RepID=A0AAD5ICA9_ACENE|nr:hypothetical protein LWI28_005037 [Acer negundo]